VGRRGSGLVASRSRTERAEQRGLRRGAEDSGWWTAVAGGAVGGWWWMAGMGALHCSGRCQSATTAAAYWVVVMAVLLWRFYLLRRLSAVQNVGCRAGPAGCGTSCQLRGVLTVNPNVAAKVLCCVRAGPSALTCHCAFHSSELVALLTSRAVPVVGLQSRNEAVE
jgi:hypothetical protein